MAQTTAEAGDWWRQALASPLAIRLTVAAGITLVLVVLLGRACLRLRPRQRQGGESGVATLEFTLVFPILLTFSLLLIQTALLYAGNLVVHSAAFAATRAAIVQIPYDDQFNGEPSNVIYNGPSGATTLAGWGKYDRIRWAGVVGVWPVSGPGEPESRQADGIHGAMTSYFNDLRGSAPAWVDTLIEDRLHYAADHDNTRITIRRMRLDDHSHQVVFEALADGDYETFGPREPITVQLIHRFNLSVPYVRSVYAEDSQDIRGGYRGMYTEISTQYTLTNEGLMDELPPLPDLERLP